METAAVAYLSSSIRSTRAERLGGRWTAVGGRCVVGGMPVPGNYTMYTIFQAGLALARLTGSMGLGPVRGEITEYEWSTYIVVHPLWYQA